VFGCSQRWSVLLIRRFFTLYFIRVSSITIQSSISFCFQSSISSPLTHLGFSFSDLIVTATYITPKSLWPNFPSSCLLLHQSFTLSCYFSLFNSQFNCQYFAYSHTSDGLLFYSAHFINYIQFIGIFRQNLKTILSTSDDSVKL
jgi:hypothetical protein